MKQNSAVLIINMMTVNIDKIEQFITCVVRVFSFNKLEWQQAMDNNHQMGKTQISMNVVALLESIRAAHAGASASCAQIVYEIFQPILYHLAELLDLFHNYNYVVVEIFQVLCSVVQNLTFLQSHKVYEICMACIRNYVKHSRKWWCVE